MKKRITNLTRIALVFGFFLFSANIAVGDVCKGYPPQAPRDIDNLAGENTSNISTAPNRKIFRFPPAMAKTVTAVDISAMIASL